MAKGFNETNGGAIKKAKVDYFDWKMGENTFRIVSGVLPRYVYWVPAAKNGKPFPVECLGFDRDQERFTNVTRDVVQERMPDIDNCKYAYVCQVLTQDGEVKVMNLKSKFFKELQSLCTKTAKRKGMKNGFDVTDLMEGSWVTVEKKKTGPKAYNIEYIVDPFSLEPGTPLSADHRAVVADAVDLDSQFERQTPEEIGEYLDRLASVDGDGEGEGDAEVTAEPATVSASDAADFDPEDDLPL